MNKKDIRLVDKSLVHMEKEENIFIYDVCRALPVTIDVQVFENQILPFLQAKERDFCLEVYSPVFSGSEIQFYLLAGMTGSIKKAMVPGLSGSYNLSLLELRRLLNFYHLDEKNDVYLLRKDLDPMDEIAYFKLIKQDSARGLDPDTRFKLAGILEQVPWVREKNYFSAGFLVNTGHCFFFDYPDDCVPGLMTAEAARQLVSACFYKFGNVPAGETGLQLSNLDLEHRQYLWPHLPVRMIAVIDNIEYNSNNTWWAVDNARVYIYQQDQQCVVYRLSLKLPLAGVNRTTPGTAFENRHKSRFTVRTDFMSRLLLRDACDKEYEGKLLDISPAGFRITTDFELNRINGEYDFFAIFQDLGLSHGRCALRWVKPETGYTGCQAGFEITGIREPDSLNLDSVIRTHCYLKDSRA